MGEHSASISMQNISFQYGNKKVLENFNLNIDGGKIYALIGSSGSGKTTTLRLMNGLLEPKTGSMFIDGKEFDYKDSEKWRRSMGYSIQGSGLFPHMTIYENLSIIARKEKWSKKKIQKRISELCQLVNLPDDKVFLQKKPRQISGGQQQRVGIARALFMSPKVILMDEPFSALDPITRSEIQKEFLSLQEKIGLTIVLVTHDLPEAFAMADEIVLLNQGKIEQKARPSRFLLAPATEYVEKFMASHSPGNLLKEIYLYSVISPDIFMAQKRDNKILLQNIETEEQRIFDSLEQAQTFLESKKQYHFYWVNKDKTFKSFQSFENGSLDAENTLSLKSTENILEAMKTIISTQKLSIPTVNADNKLVGVFSKGALDAL